MQKAFYLPVWALNINDIDNMTVNYKLLRDLKASIWGMYCVMHVTCKRVFGTFCFSCGTQNVVNEMDKTIITNSN